MYLAFLSLIFIFFANFGVYAEMPKTIPSIKHWEEGNADFYFSDKLTINILNENDSELTQISNIFNEDLENIKNYNLAIKYAEQVSANQITFSLLNSYDTLIKDEGYIVKIDSMISISANTHRGLFYATRTLLQMIRNKNIFSQGIIIDYPDYPERAFMMDMGRKYVTIDWIKNHILELSYLKLNTFHFHLSENYGFRLESEQYPEIIANEHYTKKEMKDIIEYAEKYYIEIIPEIDMPGHMGKILEAHPELQLRGIDGWILNEYIDITLDTSRVFMQNIIMEYIDLFPSKYWHIGGDEYLSSEYDKFPQLEKYAKEKISPNAVINDVQIEFLNWANKLVKSKGKVLRIWNDIPMNHMDSSNYLTLDNDVVIDVWHGLLKTEVLMKKDYVFSNCNIDFLYYNTGGNWSYDREQVHYEVLFPHHFNWNYIEAKLPNVLGYKFHVWCDNPNDETADHISIGIRNTLRIVSQKSWGSNLIYPTYSGFETLIADVKLAPKVNFPENPMPGNLLFQKKGKLVSHSANELSIDSLNDAFYNTSVSFADYKNIVFEYDLLDTFKINKIKWVWFRELPKEFKVYSSKDGNNWQHTYTGDANNLRLTVKNDFDFIARYIRFEIVERQENAETFGLCEIECYGELYKDDTSVSDERSKKNIAQIFPNPSTSGEFSIKILDKSKNNIRIEVRDLKGGVIKESLSFSQVDDLLHINLNNYSSASYLLNIYSDSELIHSEHIIFLK